MSTLAKSPPATARRGAYLLAGPLVVAAGLMVLAALWFLFSVLSALPQAGAVELHLSLRERAMPPARASAAPRSGTTVPAASEVFAGRAAVVEAPTPTF
jgi:hypothetical protein